MTNWDWESDGWCGSTPQGWPGGTWKAPPVIDVTTIDFSLAKVVNPYTGQTTNISTLLGSFLQRAGDTLAGPLTLWRDPATDLEPATKRYVDQFITTGGGSGGGSPGETAARIAADTNLQTQITAEQAARLSAISTLTTQVNAANTTANTALATVVSGSYLSLTGGNVSGPTSITQSGVGTLFTVNDANSLPTDTGISKFIYTANHTGGTSGIVNPNVLSDVTVYNAPATNIWGVLSKLNYTGTASTGQHVASYSQTLRSTQNVTNPQLWAGCFEYRDLTGQPSSTAGVGQTLELDWYGNGLDDLGSQVGRTVLPIVIGKHLSGGSAVEVTSAITTNLVGGLGSGNGWYRDTISVSSPFKLSAFTTRFGEQLAGAKAIWLADGHVLAFNTAGTKTLAWDGSAVTGAGNFNLPVLATGSTTPRMMADRLAEWVNVSDYGAALGAGTTDDTAAFQAALNAADIGQTIYVPHGHVNVSSLTSPRPTLGNLWRLNGLRTSGGSPLFSIGGLNDVIENYASRRLIISRGVSAPTDFATCQFSYTMNHTTGSGVAGNLYCNSNISSTPTMPVWNFQSILNNSTTGGSAGNHTSAYVQCNRQVSNASSQYGLVVENRDLSGDADPIHGFVTCEMDLIASGGDAGGLRRLLDGKINMQTGATSMVATYGYRLSAASGTAANVTLNLPFCVEDLTIGIAAFSSKDAILGTGAKAIWIGDNQPIAFNTAGTKTLLWDGTNIVSTAPITVPSVPTTNLQLANKQYVDAAAGQQGTLLDTFFVTGDADYGAALTRAITANAVILLGPRTYTVNNWGITSSNPFILIGVPGMSTIQRTAGSTGDWFCPQCPSVVITGVTFDANKAAVTANQWPLRFTSAVTQALVRNCVFKNNSGTLGMGLAIVGSGATGDNFLIADNEFTGNTNAAVYLNNSSGIIVRNNWIHNNSSDGVRVTAVSTRCLVQSNRIISNGGNGILLGGIAPPYIFGSPLASYSAAKDNYIEDNTNYQILAQGDYLEVSGNTCIDTGAGPFGSIDALSRWLTVRGNTVIMPNTFWGIDIGGCWETLVLDNRVTVAGIGVNAGGTQDCVVAGNYIDVSGSHYGMMVLNVEAGGGSAFPTVCSGLRIERNKINLSGTTCFGISITDAAGLGKSLLRVTDNEFTGVSSAADSQALQVKTTAVLISGNTWNGSNQCQIDPSTGLMIFPDVYDIIRSNGSTANITAFVPWSVNAFTAKITAVTGIVGGSGYNQGTTTVSFTGGGGSGAAGNVQINNGVIVGVTMTSIGSLYTSAPTVAFTDTGGTPGTGASGTAVFQLTIPQQREITYLSSANGTQTLSRTGAFNTSMKNGTLVDTILPTQTAIKLRYGGIGTWYQISSVGQFGAIVQEPIGDSLTAAGTNLATALVLTAKLNRVTTVAAGTGVTATIPVGGEIVIYNRGANPLLFYQPVAAAIDDGTAGVPIEIAPGNRVKIGAVTTTRYYTSAISSGNRRTTRVVTASGAITVATADDVIVVNQTSGAAITVNLPSSPVTGTVYEIKDGKGDSTTNNITITPAAGTIDGGATFVIAKNYTSISLLYNGSEWNVL
jgi:hypothetical protein